MLSQSTQTFLVQARIDELHRVARTSNRPATTLATLVKRTLNRVFTPSDPPRPATAS